MAGGGVPAARSLKAKGLKPSSDASKKTKTAFTKMSNAGRNGFKKKK